MEANQVEQITQSNASQEEKIAQFIAIINSADPKPGSERAFVQFIDSVAKIAYSKNMTKPVIDAFLDHITSQGVDQDFQINVLKETLDILVPSLVAYEEQEIKARAKLADLYQAQEEFQQAARVLQDGLNNASDRQLLTENTKFDTYVRIVRCYLETDQPELAEAPLSRAQHTRPYVTQTINPESDLHFKLSQARIFDANRKFLEASNKYHIISREEAVEEDDRLVCLSQAIICSVLSPAGPLRGQSLRRLYNDERSKQLAQWGILEKVFLDRLLLPKDVEEFEKQLQPHQKAITADGNTVLGRAVIEHNVMAVSKIYNNIGITELGKFLGLEKDRAEDYTAKMITQNRLAGKIDQVAGLIYFKSQLDTEPELNNNYDYANSDDSTGNGLVLLKSLDVNIQEMCTNLEQIVTALHQSHGEFVESRLN